MSKPPLAGPGRWGWCRTGTEKRPELWRQPGLWDDWHPRFGESSSDVQAGGFKTRSFVAGVGDGQGRKRNGDRGQDDGLHDSSPGVSHGDAICSRKQCPRSIRELETDFAIFDRSLVERLIATRSIEASIASSDPRRLLRNGNCHADHLPLAFQPLNERGPRQPRLAILLGSDQEDAMDGAVHVVGCALRRRVSRGGGMNPRCWMKRSEFDQTGHCSRGV